MTFSQQPMSQVAANAMSQASVATANYGPIGGPILRQNQMMQG